LSRPDRVQPRLACRERHDEKIPYDCQASRLHRAEPDYIGKTHTSFPSPRGAVSEVVPVSPDDTTVGRDHLLCDARDAGRSTEL